MVITVFACKAQQINPTKITEKNRQLLMATLYFQKAAENRALYHQAFNFARLSLDKDLETNTSTQKRAVVVDIDETLLDNSPFEAKCILEGTSYPKYWSEWTAQASAEALPGAQEFLNYAASKGVEVFYISNRKTNEYDATVKNLSEKGFPMVDSKHLVLRTTTSNKEDRRQALLNDYRIVMLAGDNLNDFTAIFEKQNSDRRNTLVDSLKNDFGKKFIILPNSMYGDWENALFNYNNQLTESQKDSIRLSYLKSF
jgi:5'-nucleotidase (lipoprotein e(P4) family)